MLSARSRAGLTQEAVAARMGTTKSAISGLEAAGKHAPCVASLKKYAEAVGCKLKIELVPQRAKRSVGTQPDVIPSCETLKRRRRRWTPDSRIVPCWISCYRSS
ncbi:MAG: helix-turn-helix domain-containing protein [Gammaproteobacteria bacterium]